MVERLERGVVGCTSTANASPVFASLDDEHHAVIGLVPEQPDVDSVVVRESSSRMSGFSAGAQPCLKP